MPNRIPPEPIYTEADFQRALAEAIADSQAKQWNDTVREELKEIRSRLDKANGYKELMMTRADFHAFVARQEEREAQAMKARDERQRTRDRRIGLAIALVSALAAIAYVVRM